jgi:hypothetical protein
MHIIVDFHGNIQSSTIPLREGTNIVGRVYGRVLKEFVLTPLKIGDLEQEVSAANLDASGVVVFVEKGRVVWAAPDVCVSRDLFYAKNENGTWILSDNFFEITSSFPKLHWRRQDLVFFLQHGYFSPGVTFFKEIARVRAGCKLVFKREEMREESVWEQHGLEDRSYEVFKKSINSVLEVRGLKDRDALLLSGGCDSGLLAAIATKVFGKHPLTCTSIYRQTLKINEQDGLRARRVSSHLGLEHIEVPIDLENEEIDPLYRLVDSIPLSAHFGITFFRTYEELARRGRATVWTGQNADSLYNFGPTGRSTGGMLKRWYLSREYWEVLPDITTRKPWNQAMKWGGEVGMLALRLKKGMRVRQPESFAELLFAFENEEGSFRFPKAGSAHQEDSGIGSLSYQEAKHLFFDRKIQTFLSGGDPRVHYGAADTIGGEAMLVYSAANMMAFWRGLPLTLRDVFSPKRYIYQYLQELLGKKAYKSLYGKHVSALPGSEYVTWAEWQKQVLQDTRFGKEVREEAGRLSEFPFLAEICNPDVLHHSLDAFWMLEVFKKVKQRGVQIGEVA